MALKLAGMRIFIHLVRNSTRHRSAMPGLAVLVLGSISATVWGQTAAPIVLKVDLENVVGYWDDGVDFSKLGSNPAVTTPVATRRVFQAQVQIGDIVAVNGRPTNGTFVMNARNLNLGTTIAAGQSIADATRTGIAQYTFEFLRSNGASVGTIFASSLNGGTAATGTPAGTTQANGAVVGGSGAYWGAQGQVASTSANPPVRAASFSEDTATRRINGGGKIQYVLQITVPERPSVVSTSTGPAIVHASNNQLVTGSNPAQAGETLVLYARGLGPASGTAIGQPFPSAPLAVVVAPVDVTVNGASATVSYAGGYPGALDGYQVNFTLPAGLASGPASLQLASSWIPGDAVNLPIQ